MGKRKLEVYSLFVAPLSANPDEARREYVLNVLLSALSLLAVIALLLSFISLLTPGIQHRPAALLSNLFFLIAVSGLLVLSRKGKPQLSSLLFIGLLGIVLLEMLLGWGFMLPQAQLFLALVLVMCGVLISARAALISTAFLSALLLIVTHTQIRGWIRADTSWLNEPFLISDAVGYIIILTCIGLVSWLSNRETDRSLQRARVSEATLANERDNLEHKVRERTRQLEQTQLKRLLELERFAEYGRQSAHLLHEISNPLTAASINLELAENQKSMQIRLAKESLKHMEQYVRSARAQLNRESAPTTFRVSSQIRELVRLFKPIAAKQGLTISLSLADDTVLHGDPVRFKQALSNLIKNSVEAYAAKPLNRHRAIIELKTRRQAGTFSLSVTDHGDGIPADVLPHIFEPFYTTKTGDNKGMGIGLSLTKAIIEDEFKGRLKVRSSSGAGTTFTMVFKGINGKPS